MSCSCRAAYFISFRYRTASTSIVFYRYKSVQLRTRKSGDCRAALQHCSRRTCVLVSTLSPFIATLDAKYDCIVHCESLILPLSLRISVFSCVSNKMLTNRRVSNFMTATYVRSTLHNVGNVLHFLLRSNILCAQGFEERSCECLPSIRRAHPRKPYCGSRVCSSRYSEEQPGLRSCCTGCLFLYLLIIPFLVHGAPYK